MSDRFAPLAGQARHPAQAHTSARSMAITRALPAPSLSLLDLLSFAMLVVLIRLF